jgi:hypothetical protein
MAVDQVQDDDRPLDMVRRGGARAGECSQGGAGFSSQDRAIVVALRVIQRLSNVPNAREAL